MLTLVSGDFVFQRAPKPGEYFFDSNGVKIHNVVSGQGEPVILIHGFGGRTAAIGGAVSRSSRKSISGSRKRMSRGIRWEGFITSKLLILHPERIKSAVVGDAGWLDRCERQVG
jgi:pimeloyl-ACP methyl ester carboxylesterase